MKGIVWTAGMLLLVGLFFTGCSPAEHPSSTASNSKEYVEVDLSGGEITRVNVYYWIVPAQAEKKVVEESENIAAVLDALSQMEIMGEGASAPVLAGGSTVLLEIEHPSGTRIYRFSSNRMQSSQGLDQYIRGADPDALWKSLTEPAQSVGEADIPTIT